jgi:hypothetical protein
MLHRSHLLALCVTLALSITITPHSEAGGKGEIIESIILYGLGRGAVATSKELMQEEGDQTPKRIPEFKAPSLTTPFPDSCSSSSKSTSECGNAADLLKALKADKSKEAQEPKTDRLLAICEPTSQTYDGLRCMQEKQLREQLEATSIKTPN